MESIEHINYLRAPAYKVYRALVTQEGLAEVWTKNLKVRPEEGFINEFDFNEGYLTKMKVLELQENRRIVWECVESDEEWIGTEISFELTEKQGVTTVLLRHYKWRSRTEYFGWCSYNWALFLYRLQEYCERD